MDLWDVIRLMVRRWYVSVPMLLLTLGALVWTGVTVSPNHTAEAHIMVLPPVSVPNPEVGEERIINPWTTDSLAGAIVTSLRNHNLHERLEEEGHRAEWEAGLDLQFLSVIQIEVTSPTEHEAQAAVSRLLQEVNNEVATRQADYDIPETEKITTVTLGAGENINVVRGNQIRALVVVFAAGMILTMALTIGVDAVGRRRAARLAPAGGAGARTGGGTQGDPAAERPVPAPRPAEPVRPANQYAAANGTRAEFGGVSSALGAEHRPESGPAPGGGGHSGITVSYRPQPESAAGSAGAEPGGHDRGGGGAGHPDRTATDLEDATIVLPLSGTDLRRKDRPEPPRDGSGSRKAHDH